MVFDYFFVVWACPKSKVSNLMGNAGNDRFSH